MVQACEDSETAIKIAGKGYGNELNDVLALKAELLENIQGDNPTDQRKKYTEFSSKLVAVRQDFDVNYGDLRETYGSDCTNTSRRAEFNDTYVTPFNKWLVELANKLHSQAAHHKVTRHSTLSTHSQPAHSRDHRQGVIKSTTITPVSINAC